MLQWRETLEEVGPYRGCDQTTRRARSSGTPYVADEEELAEVEWCDRAKLTSYVPYPFFGPVEEYFDATLA